MMKKFSALLASSVLLAGFASMAWAAAPADGEYDAAAISFLNDHGLGSVTADAELIKKVVVWNPGKPKKLRGFNLDATAGKMFTGDIDLSQFKDIVVVQMVEPAITSLTLNNPDLNDIRVVTSPSLTSITLGDLPKLRHINISQTGIGGAFDISRFSGLYSFKAIETKITEATAVGMTALRAFELKGCRELKKVTVKDCPDLLMFNLSKTSVSDVTISGSFPKLSAIDLKDASDLTALDLSGADTAAIVTVEGATKLASLNIKGMSKLKVLRANRTALTELDLTGCESLEKLSIRGTGIKRLVVTGCPKLTDKGIDCGKDVEIVR